MSISKADLPTYHRLLNPTLRGLRRLGGSASIHEIEEEIVSDLQLAEDIANLPHGKGSQTEIGYRAAWARTYLKHEGLIENPKRGIWALTAAGAEAGAVDSGKLVREVARKQRVMRRLRRRQGEIALLEGEIALLESGLRIDLPQDNDDPLGADEPARQKNRVSPYDVFICYHSEDEEHAESFSRTLMSWGITPWFAPWECRPGLPWLRALEREIQNIRSAAVIVGKSGIGPWQSVELDGCIRAFVRRSVPVIPVILPNCSTDPELPVFLEGMTHVDFRKRERNPWEHMIWGITGKKPGYFKAHLDARGLRLAKRAQETSKDSSDARLQFEQLKMKVRESRAYTASPEYWETVLENAFLQLKETLTQEREL